MCIFAIFISKNKIYDIVLLFTLRHHTHEDYSTHVVSLQYLYLHWFTRYSIKMICILKIALLLHINFIIYIYINICITNDHGYLPHVVNTSRSFPHSWLITGYVTRLTRWVPLVVQELLTLPDHMS